MRFQLDAADLRKAIAASSSVVRPSDDWPILTCLLMSAKDNRLTIIGSNRSTEVHTKSEASVSDSGVAAANAADLKAITARLKGVVSISVEQNRIDIKATSGAWSLPVAIGEFPRLAKPEVEIEIEQGIEALAACEPFCATSLSSPNLRGVIFDGEVAFGCSGSQIMLMPSLRGNGQIIPREAVATAIKYGERLFLSDQTWRVEAEGTAALGRLLDYPPLNWRQIDFNNDPIAHFEADEMLAAIEAATVGRAESFNLKSDGQTAIIVGREFKGDHIESECRLRCDGAPMNFTASVQRVSNALKAFPGSVIALSSNGNAIKLRPEGGVGQVMFTPLRDVETHLEAA